MTGMAAAPDARGAGQTDVQPAFSRTPSSSPGDLAVSSHPTPASIHPAPSPTPPTPYRGRTSSRYPDSLGRVPLHRRGTSKTYERLEDLLREAGYKETRVFTPENDRNARSAAEKLSGSAGNGVRGSVGAVVDFIAGLVSRGPSLSREAAPLEDDIAAQSSVYAWLPPSSPLAHVKDNRPVKRVSSAASLSPGAPSQNIPGRSYVDLSTEATHAHQVVHLHQSSQGPHQLRSHRRHNNHHHHQLNYSSKSISSKTNPPNAHAYLRHMASAPNIQPIAKRPSLSEASLRSYALGRERRHGTRRTIMLNDEDSIAESDYESHSRATIIDDDERQAHPLPRNWIESVTQSLLSGIAGPSAATSDAASTRTVKTASTRKSTALSDKSNREERGRVPTRVTKPPLLCVQVQDVKARTSEGQVACTRVMCRSTPTSRASSRARNGAHDDRTKARDGQRRKAGKRVDHRKGADRDAYVLPSLARTKVENDNWSPRPRYSDGWEIENSPQAYPNGTQLSDESEGEDDEDGDEDEEGELGLDRLLVPARRQHSIQSLRKHLQRSLIHGHGASRLRSPRTGRTSPFEGSPTRRRDWGNASWSTSRGQEWLSSQGEEDEDGHYVYSGAVRKSSTKWRNGLPGLTQWTTSS